MIGSGLRSRAFYTLAAVSILALSLAYQVRTHFCIDLGTGRDGPFLRYFHDAEQADSLSYRWSSDRSFILLPGIGSDGRLILRISLNGYRPSGLLSPLVHVKANGRELSSFTPTAQFETYEFIVDRETIGIPGNLELEVDSEVFVPAQVLGGDDLRQLGVLIDSVSAEFQEGATGAILPPPVHLLSLWCAVLASYFLARLCWPTRSVSFVIAGLVLLALLALVIQQRLLVGLYSAQLAGLLVLANLVAYGIVSERRTHCLRARLRHLGIEEGKQALTLALIFVAVFFSHSLSRVCCYAGDSVWSVPVAMSIIRERNTDVDEYDQIVVSNDYYGEMVVRNDNHYTVEEIRGHLYSKQPIGASIVAVPALLVADNVLGHLFHADLDHFVRNGGSGQLERLLASSIVALTAMFLCLIALRFLDRKYSLLLVLVFAFCTSAWSTASRALWQHGPSMLMLSAALYLILVARDRPSSVQFASIPLALAFVVRPTNSITVLLLTVYVAVQYRRYFLRYLLWATTIAAPFLAFNLTVYHSPFSTYYLPQKVGSNPSFLEALAANLVSPGRGLFIFSPVVLLSVGGVILKIRDGDWRRLDSALLAIVILHWVVISSFGKWWAGHSFGPRFFCDVIPYLVYLAIPVFSGLSGLRGSKRMLLAALVSFLVVVSLFIHYRGATSWATHVWNEEPVGVDDDPSRVWDWTDIQFLRGIAATSPLAHARVGQSCVVSLDESLRRPPQVEPESAVLPSGCTARRIDAIRLFSLLSYAL
jgi:hypothetical protein